MSKEMHFRMDFIQEVIGFDAKTGLVKVRLIPDPKRYRRITIHPCHAGMLRLRSPEGKVSISGIKKGAGRRL